MLYIMLFKTNSSIQQISVDGNYWNDSVARSVGGLLVMWMACGG